MSVNRACPICQSTSVEVLHKLSFELPDGHPGVADGYNVVACVSCGFVFADTNIKQSDYDSYYANNSKYEDAQTGTGGTDNPYDWQRQKETALQISDILPNAKARILDVGCANGGLLKALKDFGYNSLCGIDPSSTCVDNTRRLGIEAYQGSLFLPFEQNSFDCVILSHVLEHVCDLQSALRWILKRLKQDALLYIEVPDATRYVDYLYSPFQDFNTEHINHFSLKCLTNLMAMHGFILTKCGTKDPAIGMSLFFPTVFGFWMHAGNSELPPIEKDFLLRIKIEEYIAASKRIMLNLDSRISLLLHAKSPLIVWGTGQLLLKLLAETSLRDANIVAFIDSNPINHGKTLHGKPILPPGELKFLNHPILIATLLHSQSICNQIKEMMLTNEIILLQGE